MGRGVSLHFFVTALILFATVSWLSHGAWAWGWPLQETDVQRLAMVATDAEKGLVCTLDVVVAKTSREAQGLVVDCGQPTPTHKVFSVEQLRGGVPLVHKDDKNLDVITLAVTDFDPVHGGMVKLRYLSNYLGKVFQDWFAEIHGDGGQWILYTTPDEGHRPFNHIFAAKRTKFTITVGIKEFRTSWVEGPVR